MNSSKLLVALLAAGVACGLALLLVTRHLAVTPAEVSAPPTAPAVVEVKAAEPVSAHVAAVDTSETTLTNKPTAVAAEPTVGPWAGP